MSKKEWQPVPGRTFEQVDIPSGINLFVNNDYKNLHNDVKKMKIHINYPHCNMQDDKVAFEGWSLIFHTKLNCEIVLSFESVNFNWSLVNLPAEKLDYDYMRFLYRVWKFAEQMPWFSIEDANYPMVEKFKTEFLQLKEQNLLINNRPTREAQLSKSKSKSEHFFENAFVRHEGARELLMKILREEDNIYLQNLYNQLPNGLFKGNLQKDITEPNRIFPTGFFDMWGISEDNELCLFELKVAGNHGEDVENKSVGIISELYFYAQYCRDIFLEKKCNLRTTNHRGYDKLLSAAKKGIPKIKAYFLAPQYHARIEENILKLEKCLNYNSPLIEYKFLKYDYEQVKAFVEEIR
ncbi:MAG: hypothetical protein GX958_03415 [Desulfitobacterium sp.]|nr:hypothetical protein [Desulfitobacterium sp.]